MSRPQAPRRAAPAAAALLAFLLGACQGSDPQPLTLVSLDPFAGAASLVDGGGAGSVLGYSEASGGAVPVLRLVRHDASDPGRLSFLGDVVLPDGGRLVRLRVTDEAAAAVVSGAVWVVDLADPSLAPARLPASDTASDVAVRGRWAAVAVDHGLEVLDRDDVTPPVAFTASATPSAPFATRSGFLAFTATGYLVVDVTGAAPSVREVADASLAGLLQARPTADLGGAIAAGPGTAFDRSRLVRLDLSDPGAPTLVRAAEVPGALVALASDGAGAAVLAVHGEGDDPARPETFHQGWLLAEGPAGFEARLLPLSLWSLSEQPLAAHAGHLLAIEAGGAALLRIR